MTVFALPTVFRAAAIDGRGDAWIANTLHIRVRLWRELGFPLHPFTAWRAHRNEERELTVTWVTPDGRRIDPPFNPADVGGLVEGTVLGTTGNGFQPPEWCWLGIDAEPFDNDFRIEALDRLSLPTGAPRVVATRRKPPYEFGGTALGRIRIGGSGEVRGVRGLHAGSIDLRLMDGPPNHQFGLPIQTTIPWYAGLPDPLGAVKDRLFLGAGLRLGPPDQPDGPFDSLNPDGEASRILDILAPQTIDDWLQAAYRDPTIPPSIATQSGSETTPSGADASASISAVDALMTMAVDPDVARYLGLATALHPDEALLEPGPNIWIIASQWAVQPNRPIGHLRRPLTDWLSTEQPPDWLTTVLDGLFPETPRLKDEIVNYNINNRLKEAEWWQPITLVAVAVAAGGTPPDPPDSPTLELRETASWNPGTAGTSWTQPITLAGRAAEGPLATARLAPEGTTSLHRINPDGRAAALLAPWSSRTDPVTTPNGISLRARERVFADVTVPADPAGATWRLRQADQWGRWSEPAEIAGPQPARPNPPPPLIEGWFVEAEAVTDPGLHSPGLLRLRVTAPPATALAPGGRPIATITLASNDVDAWTHGGTVILGPAVTVAAAEVDTENPALVEAVIRPLEVGEAATVTIVATATDDEGRTSTSAVDEHGQAVGPGTLRRDVFDPRPRPPILTAPRLLWCSQPDGTGRSELALRWPTLPGHAAYRVYLGDERRLADALAIPVAEIVPTVPRAVRALTVWDRARTVILTSKDAFTLLTEDPIAASGDQVTFLTQVPGTLRGVQFIRIVPLTASGVETPFGECGLIPVAIPSSDRPPVPLLRATANPDGTVALRIEAPGLVVPAGASEPPRYRLRRTRGAITDALFIPVVREGDLVQTADGWSADVIDGDLDSFPAFVRHTWVAEIRLPAEPDLAPSAVAIPTVAGPLWDTSHGPAPAAWSAPSLPASTAIVPVEPPDAPDAVTVAHNPDGTATLTIPAPPLAHPRAPGPFTAAVFRETAGGPTIALPPLAVTTSPFTFVDAPPGDGYQVALIDPLGRMGAPAAATPV